MADLIAFGKIENFSEGWGVVSHSASTSHFWKRVTVTPFTGAQKVYSVCGINSYITNAFPMLNEGNFPRCKTCKRINETK